MRLLVTGSRTWHDPMAVEDEIWKVWAERHVKVTVVQGGAHGVDSVAARFGRRQPDRFTVETHPVTNHPSQDFGPWPAAGQKRNAYMVSLGADLCLAFVGPCEELHCLLPRPHGSHGASACADMAEKAGIPTRRYTTEALVRRYTSD